MPGLPNLSPFCMKLETYLRMRGQEVSIERVRGGGKSPTGKIPYIKLDGEVIADSGLIVSELERRLPNPVDADLSATQLAESVALQRMLEEHLYWVIVYSRWQDPEAWTAFKNMVSGNFGAPALLLDIFRPLLRRRVRNHMHGHGIGRHSADKLWSLGTDDAIALADWLADREWAFGERPHVLDACISAFTASVICMPWDYPLKSTFLSRPNLGAHLDRTMQAFYPEYAEA